MTDIKSWLCYFCDVPYTVLDDRLIKNYNNLFICTRCEKDFPINYDNRENGNCPMCMNYNSLIKLGVFPEPVFRFGRENGKSKKLRAGKREFTGNRHVGVSTFFPPFIY